MTITRILKTFIVCVMMTAMVPAVSIAMNNATAISTPAKDPEAEAKMLSRIITRVTEIQNMDKSNLSPAEKKSLRKELKEMKKEADGLDSRVYLSVGAIIIIILLLILILR